MKWSAYANDPDVVRTEWVHEEDGDSEWMASVERCESCRLEVRDTGRILYEAFFDTMTDAIRRGESILRAFTVRKRKTCTVSSTTAISSSARYGKRTTRPSTPSTSGGMVIVPCRRNPNPSML